MRLISIFVFLLLNYSLKSQILYNCAQQYKIVKEAGNTFFKDSFKSVVWDMEDPKNPTMMFEYNYYQNKSNLLDSVISIDYLNEKSISRLYFLYDGKGNISNLKVVNNDIVTLNLNLRYTYDSLSRLTILNTTDTFFVKNFIYSADSIIAISEIRSTKHSSLNRVFSNDFSQGFYKELITHNNRKVINIYEDDLINKNIEINYPTVDITDTIVALYRYNSFGRISDINKYRFKYSKSLNINSKVYTWKKGTLNTIEESDNYKSLKRIFFKFGRKRKIQIESYLRDKSSNNILRFKIVVEAI